MLLLPPSPEKSAAPALAPLSPVLSCPLTKPTLQQIIAPPPALMSRSVEPCDIDSITITIDPPPESVFAKYLAEGWLGTLIKEDPDTKPIPPITLAPLSGPPATPARLAGTLTANSVSVAVVAKQEPDPGKTANGRKLTVDLKVGPGYCSKEAHPHLLIDPLPGGFTGSMPMRSAPASSKLQLYAPRQFSDGLLTSAFAPFQAIWALMTDSTKTRTYVVAATTCGNRDTPKAVHSLSANIEVWPECVIIFRVKVPEIITGSLSASNKTTKTRLKSGAVYEVEKLEVSGKARNYAKGYDENGLSEYGANFKYTATDRALKSTNGKTYSSSTDKFETGQQLAVKGDDHLPGGAIARTDDGTDSKISEYLEDEAGYFEQIELSLTYNGASIATLSNKAVNDAYDTVGGLAKTASDKVADARKKGQFADWRSRIALAKRLVQSAQDLARMMNRQVQVGWKVNGTVNLFSGELKLVWGYKQFTKEMRVGKYLGVQGSLVLIEASAEVSFGLCLAFSNLRDQVDLLDARIIGTLTGTVSLDGSYEQITGLPKRGTSLQLTGAVDLKLQVKIVVIKIVSVDGNVTGGVEAVGGFTGNLEEEPKCSITVGFKQIVGSCTVKSLGFKVFNGKTTLIEKTQPFIDVDF